MFKSNHCEIITGLDIGTDTIKILVALKKPEQTELEILTKIKKRSTGVRKGVVVKPEKVAEEVRSLIDEVKNSTGQKIDSIYLNINGSHLSTVFSRGTIAVSRADREISQVDIDRVIQTAQTISLPQNKEIIDCFTREFVIDGEEGIKEALGMKGIRLEVNVLLLCALSPYLQNLSKAVSNTGLQIIDTPQSSPIAAADAVLTPQQKELGVALVDIGAETTGLAIFEEEDLIHTAIFPVGSAHITNDLAIGLKCEIDLAEKIKKELGVCISKKKKGEKYKRDKIKISDSLEISRKMLTGIIEARVSEIFELVNKELKQVSRQKLLPAGIVLTGGGVNLPKIVELVKKDLKLSCRIGKPRGFIGLEDDPSLATVCGLVLGGVDFEKNSDFPNFRIGKGITSKIKRLFKIFIP